MPIDLERFRAEIPGVVNRVHLNNAGAGLMPLPVLQAMTDMSASKACRARSRPLRAKTPVASG
jgi:selenocysteine lyase/cysteine desulfurase